MGKVESQESKNTSVVSGNSWKPWKQRYKCSQWEKLSARKAKTQVWSVGKVVTSGESWVPWKQKHKCTTPRGIRAPFLQHSPCCTTWTTLRDMSQSVAIAHYYTDGRWACFHCCTLCLHVCCDACMLLWCSVMSWHEEYVAVCSLHCTHWLMLTTDDCFHITVHWLTIHNMVSAVYLLRYIMTFRCTWHICLYHRPCTDAWFHLLHCSEDRKLNHVLDGTLHEFINMLKGVE